MEECRVHPYELCWWNGKLVCEKCPKLKLIGPPVYYSGLSYEMIERMTMMQAGSQQTVVRQTESEEFSATLDGIFHSYLDPEQGQRVVLDNKSYESVQVPIDSRTGAILLAFIGGKGQYSLNFHCNGERMLEIASCEHNLFKLKLSEQARREGCQQQEFKFYPPQELIARILRSFQRTD